MQAFQLFRQGTPVSRAVIVLSMDQHDRCIRLANGCASPKFCPALKSTACTHSSAAVSAMTVPYVPPRRIMVGPVHPLLAIASKPAPGKSRPPATAGRAEAQASQTPDGKRLTKSSGYSRVVFGVLGSSLWCSSILRQSFAGIALVFDCTGV